MRSRIWLLPLALACKPADEASTSDTDDTEPTGPACALDVQLSWSDNYPTVPQFSFSPTADGTSATLRLDDGSHIQQWSLDLTTGQDTIAVPLDPGVNVSYTLEVPTAEGTCVGTGTFDNGAYTEGGLESTWVDDSGGRDFFVLPIHVDGTGDLVVLWNERGEPLWRFAHNTNLRSAEIDDRGRGVWLLELQDGFVGGFDEDAATELQLISWTGDILETLATPAGHHDWQIGDGRGGDADTLTLLGREHMTALEAQCGEVVYGDTVQRLVLPDDPTEILYATEADGFPTPVGCAGLNMGIQSGDGVAYSYFNGMQRHGDTFGVSASGIVHGLLLGGSDGAWHFIGADPAVSDLAVVPAHSDLPGQIAQAPHSVQCTEGIDWGDGAGDDPGVLTCIAYNRRNFTGGAPCDTVDLFQAHPDRGEVNYLATFPPKDFTGDRWEGCSTTNHHGNVGLIGEPNPLGDGVTRLALFAAASGAITVVEVTAGATGSEISLDYVVAPEIANQVTGWFATPARHLGAAHAVQSD